MTGALFEIRRLVHRYKDRTVLEEEFLDLEAGTITGISGPNGGGKSTLINILGLIVKPFQGTLTFKGEKVEPFSPVARGRIATLTQDASLLSRSVEENVSYGLRAIQHAKDRKARVGSALEAVGLAPSRFLGRSVKALSGGEARRVALAARLALRPDILLLDEPTAHVDEHSNAMIRRAVLHAREAWGTTLLISSHDREWLESISDRTLTVFSGRIFKEERVNILAVPYDYETETHKFGGTVDEFLNPLSCPPPSGCFSAILPASALHLSHDPDGIPADAVRFHSTVSGVFLSNKNKMLYATLLFRDTPLSARITASQAGTITPGQAIYAYYHPSDLSFR